MTFFGVVKTVAEKKSEENKSPLTKKEVGGYKDRFWYPRFWDGMTLGAWYKAMKSGHFSVAPQRWAMAGIITGLGFLNSFSTGIDFLINGRKKANIKLAGPPIFIIGHWRSGTTLLHEYMVLDPRFTFADTYACYTPTHFLHTRYTMAPFVKFLMPAKRPIDNMAAGLDRPQEDEFALTALGLPSPYRNILFPNNETLIDLDYLTLRDVDEKGRKEWLDTLDYFLRSLTVQSPKQIVLKSPPHTGRIRTILERYPDAKFVHINRDPFKLFPSTYNLWMRLGKDEGLQVPKGKNMEEYVFTCFERMYEAFEADLPLLKLGQFSEVAFKDLTADPLATLEKIYAELEIDGFEGVRSIFSEFADSQRTYQKNKFEIAPEIAEQIRKRWAGYIKKYGYDK